ncbi:MAG: response regulator [Pigmentiphaga sp.]
MLKLAIVDDHQIVRAGFREMLADELGLEFVFEAASAEEATAQLRQQSIDVLLLDLSLPGQSGVDLLRHSRQHYPELHVLILSGFPEERYAMAMLRHGASGYLCKDCSRDELLNAIHAVSRGRRYLSTRATDLLARELAEGGTQAPHERLSDRELQVFLRLSRGESVSLIATSLNLSAKTISTYRTRLLEKLSVTSNAELAAYAIRHGLLPDELVEQA